MTSHMVLQCPVASDIDVANVAEILDSFVLSLHMRFKILRVCKRYFTDTPELLSVLHIATCLVNVSMCLLEKVSPPSDFGAIDFPSP